MYKIFIIGILLFTISCSGSKNPKILWEKPYQINGSIIINSITKTNDGGYAICGDQHYYKKPDSTFIFKFDINSNLQWLKKFEGSNEFSFIEQTTDNGFILCGSYQKPFIDYQIWILKLDSLGGIKWQNKYGDDQWDKSKCVIETKDKTYILCGTKDRLGKNSDAWIMEFDSSGQKIFDQTYGEFGFEETTSIIQTMDSGFLIVGIRNNENTEHKAVPWILKLDKSKNIQWEKVIDFPGFSGANSVIETEDGKYVLCGYSYVVEEDAANFLIIKVDNMGNIIWQKFIGGAQQDFAKRIINGFEDEYIVIGTTSNVKWYSRLLTFFNIYAGEDLLILKLNTNGEILSQTVMGRNMNHYSSGIIKLADSKYIVCGIENIDFKKRKIIIAELTGF